MVGGTRADVRMSKLLTDIRTERFDEDTYTHSPAHTEPRKGGYRSSSTTRINLSGYVFQLRVDEQAKHIPDPAHEASRPPHQTSQEP